MFILARIKDSIIESVFVTPEIPADADGHTFVDITELESSQGSVAELIGADASSFTGEVLQELAPIVEEAPVVEAPAEEV